VLSCILSDTLEFRSPTTTQEDTAIAHALAKDLGIDIAAYAAEMFAAKSDVSAFGEAELLRMDSKEFDLGGAQEDGAAEVLLFIVDILKEEATLLVPNDTVKDIAEKSFGVQVAGDTVVLPGVMSRKKQIIPNLTL